MIFLFPAFLFGLVSLVLPVIIHLFHLRRYTRVHFSNVQFLKDIQQKESSRRKLKQRIVLLMRMLALAFLVFAFAKPYIPSPGDDKFRPHAISIFVDNSYSMEAINREGTLLDEARRRAKELASGYSINDRFQLLTQDFEGSHQRLLSRKEFYDEIDKIKISPNSRQLQQIIDRQKNLLDLQSGAVKSIFVLSDFQKNLFSSKGVTTDPDIPVRLMKLKAASLPNVTVDSAWLMSAVHSPGNSEKLIITLHNYAGERAEKVPVKVLINGIQKSLGSFTIEPRSTQRDTLGFSGLNAGWQDAEIQVQDNPVTFDNRFYLTFQVVQEMPVLLVDGGVPNNYLTAVFNAESFFKTETLHYGNIDYAKLAAYPLIVLTDVKSVPDGLAQQLHNYVKNGGTLAVFPADDADLPSYKTLLQPMGANYPEELMTDIGRVASINLQSKLFKNTFAQLPQNPDLPMVLKFYRLSADKQSAGETLFDLPGRQPFIADYNYGKGQVYLSAVPLRDDYSNLSHHALFVPLMFRMALLSGHDQPLFYTIGQNESVETSPIQASDRALIKLAGPGPVIIPDVRQQGGGTLLYFSDQVQEPGNYKLMKQDSVIAKLAFNNSRSESDLSYLTDSELKASVPGKSNLVLPAGPQSAKDAVAKAGLGPELWKICLILSLACLAAEMLLVKFFQPEKKNNLIPVA